MPSKTVHEIWVVRTFARLSGAILEGSVEAVPHDPPDVEGRTSGGDRVAVEVTDYQADAPLEGGGGSPLLAAQRQQSRITERAQHIFEERNDHLPLIVTPQWSSFEVMRVRKTDVAQRIAAVVEAILVGQSRPPMYGEIDAPSRLLDDLGLDRQLHGLTILWGERVTQPLWASGFAGIMNGDPVRFQRLIDRKARRLPHYEHRFDAAWLLVHVDIEGLGDISSAVMDARYQLHGFKAVYFFDSTREQIHCAQA